MASKYGVIAIVLLLAFGCVLTADEIHNLFKERKLDAVKLLLKKDPTLANSKNREGPTPLILAENRGSVKTAALSIVNGTDTNLKPRSQDTPLKFTILYDNYLYREGTKPDWGFSCLIQGTEKTILFDTGTNPKILMHNVEQLSIDLNRVEQIVISHNHDDHTGGLWTVLDQNPAVEVFVPKSFPYEFVRRVEEKKAKVKSVDKPEQICKDVFSTGEMGDQIKEQSLIIDMPNGLIVVTGCAHQGIVNILKRAKTLFDKPILLVFGGFHLGGKPREEVQDIIRNFKELGVKKCGATHCTGDEAIAMFKEAFGKDYVPMGTGKAFEMPGKGN